MCVRVEIARRLAGLSHRRRFNRLFAARTLVWPLHALACSAAAQAIAHFGEKDWESVARHVGTRKGLRCRQRWINTLKPGHVKGKWSDEDDAMLMVRAR
jgi:hypothetical protein